jgi:hypothetical protein
MFKKINCIPHPVKSKILLYGVFKRIKKAIHCEDHGFWMALKARSGIFR